MSLIRPMLRRSLIRPMVGRLTGGAGIAVPSARFSGDPYTEGAGDDAITVRVRNATIGTSWVVAISSSGGGTPPANQSGTVTVANFDLTFNVTGLNVGTLSLSYTEDAVEVATDTAVLQAAPVVDVRITETDDVRVTETGDRRIAA